MKPGESKPLSRAVLSLLLVVSVPSYPQSPSVVTFVVDMTGVPHFDGAYVTGSFTGPEGSWSIVRMTDEGSNVFSHRVNLSPGQHGAYYFLRGNDWKLREAVPNRCAQVWGTDRRFEVSKGDVTLAFRYGSCDRVDYSEDRYPPRDAESAVSSPATLDGHKVTSNSDQTPDRLVEEVLVTGTRLRSLADALEEKRNADSILDAVSAQDLGKLPEISIAEALARLPGVVANRDRGQATEISIRGLGANLSSTLLNGREIATGGYTRNVRYDSYPAELLHGASVFKSTKASRIDGGIGGVVDLKTVRPLDTYDRRLVANVSASYFGLGDKIDDAEALGYTSSFAYVDQLLDGSLGLALGYSRREEPIATARTNIYARTDSFKDVDADGTVAPDYNGDLVPYGYEALYRGGNDDRDGVVAAVQWRSLINLEANLDFFYSKVMFREEQRGFRVEDVAFGNDFSNAVVEDNDVKSATITKVSDYGMQMRTVNESWASDDDTYAGGLNVAWTSAAWGVTADIAYSRAEQDSQFISAQTEVHDLSGTSPKEVMSGLSSSYAVSGRGVGVFDFNVDLSDPRINLPAFVYVPDWNTVVDEVYSYGMDVVGDVGTSFLRSLSVGVRYSDRRQSLDARSAHPQIELANRRPVPPDLVNQPLSGFGSFSDLPPILSFDRDEFIAATFGGIEPVQTGADLLESNVVAEDILAGYVQAEFEGSIFGVGYRGNAGIRVVRTHGESSSTLLENSIDTGFMDALTPFSVKNDFTDVLPSLNWSFFPTEKQTIRLALAKALSRPPLNSLNAGVGVYNFGHPQAYGGNPTLEPFRANQVDLSYENYFAEGAAFSVNGFYKDLDTFIIRELEPDVPLPTGENGTFVRPVNRKGGHIAGVELGLSYPLKMLPAPLDGLGIWANYTYIDSNINISPVYVIGHFSLPGLAPHTVNASIWYWKRGFEWHLGYRYRDVYATELPDVPGQILYSDTEKAILDFQIGYTFQPGTALQGLKVAVQAYNLTNEPFRTFYSFNSRGRYEEYGRRFWLSVSYEF